MYDFVWGGRGPEGRVKGVGQEIRQFYQIRYLYFLSFEHISKSNWGPGCISHELVISLSTLSDVISGKELLFEQVDLCLAAHGNFGRHVAHKSLNAITIPLNPSIKSPCS